jgi:hypothetical protein
MYPDIGRPELDMGLMFYDIPPGWPELLKGRENEVPGLGAVAIAFSSVKYIRAKELKIKYYKL